MDIIDNFLDKTEFKQIQEIIMGDEFPWYYNKHISTSTDNKHFYFFSHNFLKNEVKSELFGLWKNFLKKLNYKALIRIKGGLYPSHPEVRPNNFHVDFPFKHKGCIFYINNNNGPTVIGKKSIFPKENRAVLFDPSLPHKSSLCSNQQVRVTITFNYF
tara:strand:+ start:118 stop:591 length:474 start_codon:yes stop_codon:yes gene_type:complete